MKSFTIKNSRYIVSASEYEASFWNILKIVGIAIIGAIIVVPIIIGMAASNSNSNDVVKSTAISQTDPNDGANPNPNLEPTPTPDPDTTTPKSPQLPFPTNIPETYRVTKVVDGDTIYVEGISTRIRLIGIDTPETVHPSKPVECYGLESSNYLRSLILGKRVGLESDSNTGNTDAYGRPLRYVYFNGRNINYDMLLNGYAREAAYGTSYKYRSQFASAEKNAERDQRGLWSPTTCYGHK